MKVTFVQDALGNLAVEYLSAILKKAGHRVNLVIDPRLFNTAYLTNKSIAKIFDIREQLADKVIASKPDLVAFSVFTCDYQWALDMAGRIKKRNPKLLTIFGGIHPTVVPEVVIQEPNVDIVCVGEGEQALLELIESLKKGKPSYKIRNLWFKKKNGQIIKNPMRPLIENLDELPYPDKDLYFDQLPHTKDYYLTMATRGCPYRCTYCANNIKAQIFKGKGKYLRLRSVKSVIAELVWAKKRYPNLKRVGLPDDILPLYKDWFREFISLYKKKVNLPFVCYTHPRYLDKETAELLKEGGCFWLNIGLQTASEKNRINLLKRVESNDEVRRGVAACHQAGLLFSLDHIFGIPFEGEKEYVEGLKLYNELRPNWINVFWLVYFPKTEIIKLGRKAGFIDDETEKQINQGKISTCCTLKIGGEEDITRAKEGDFSNFALLYTLLPIIPASIMKLIIQKKLYRRIPAVPNWLFFIAKVVVRIPIGQVYLYTSEIRNMFHLSLITGKIKWQARES